jgi:hypothetical protein
VVAGAFHLEAALSERTAEWEPLAEQCAKFAAGLKDIVPRGVFTLDFAPVGDGVCVLAVYDTIPYPSDLAGFHPGKDGEARRVIDRLESGGAEFLAGAQYPDPGSGVDAVSYALLFSISDSKKKLVTRLFLEEVDEGMIE